MSSYIYKYKNEKAETFSMGESSRKISAKCKPLLNKKFFDGPEEERMVSISIFGSDSRPFKGAFEELGASVSEADASVFLATSVGVELCLVKLQSFSALNPSFSSSASFDDKPYRIFFIGNSL